MEGLSIAQLITILHGMEKKLSIQEYADLIGLTRQGVLWRINKSLHLPGVKYFEKVGRAYIMVME